MSAVGVGGVIVAVGLVGAVGAHWVVAIRGAARHEHAVFKEHKRAVRARYAAFGAGEDDPSFSPDVIETCVAEILAMAQNRWHYDHNEAVDDRPDSDLIKEWAQSWDSQLGGGLDLVGEPSIDILRVVNRETDAEDRVVLRVRQHLHCRHPEAGTRGIHRVRINERWTLGRCGDSWLLLSVSGDPLANSLLDTPLIPDPSSDTERLHEQSLAALAMEQKLDSDVVLSDLISPDAPSQLALLDLSVVDGRYSPALLEATLQHLLEVWESAVTGSEVPLDSLANADSKNALLFPLRGQRLIVRDPVMTSWETTKVDVSANPPAVEVAFKVNAVRYVVTDDGSVVAGYSRDAREMALKWTLELIDSAQTPWRLVASNNPGQEIPGWT